MKKISRVFQIFFKLVLIFFLVFVWIRYFTKSLIKSVIISALITAIIDFLTRIIFAKHAQKNQLKTKEKEDAENIFLSLAIDDGDNFFSNLFSKKANFHKHFQTNAQSQIYHFEENNEKIAVATYFNLSPLSVKQIVDVMKYVRKNKIKNITFLSGEIEQECFKFIKIFDEKIVLLNKYQTYKEIYQKENLFPKITRQPPKDKKYSIKEMFAYSINPARAKGYFFSALALFFCCLFTKMTIYYSIVISVLLLLAILSNFPFHKYSQASRQNISPK